MIQNLNTVRRNNLYFNEYNYALQFNMLDVHAIRDKSHHAIDSVMRMRMKYKSSGVYDPYITLQDLDKRRANLHEFLHFLQDTTEVSHRLVVHRNEGHLYSNKIEFLVKVSKLIYIQEGSCTQVELSEANTLELKNPTHAYRTYFNNQRIALADKTRLADFLFNYPKIRIGPGLHSFLTSWPRDTRLRQNYFIDHNDMGIITMLQLVCPASCKKTLKLVKR